MSIVHLKRYRMLIELQGHRQAVPRLLLPYQQLPWLGRLLELHAAAKFASFQHELDAVVFASLATLAGCQQLMRDISSQSNFVPAATWLVTHTADHRRPPLPVATIQGMQEPDGTGSIQNVGVVPGHRGQGLGTQLLALALEGFQRTGHRMVSLEVTAKNAAAIRLYERIGFRIERVVYRTVQLSQAAQ